MIYKSTESPPQLLLNSPVYLFDKEKSPMYKYFFYPIVAYAIPCISTPLAYFPRKEKIKAKVVTIVCDPELMSRKPVAEEVFGEKVQATGKRPR